MKLLFDFFPILLFFISYKCFGIYEATAIAMLSTLIQVFWFRFKHRHYEKLHVISCAIILVLGTATLLFHDPAFIKLKPTGIYWITAGLFLGSRWIGSKPLVQKMMEGNVSLPRAIWHQLNYAWVIFFVLMGIINLYVAYHFSTDGWVTFKLFGGAGFTLLFVCLQAVYLNRHLVEKLPSPVSPEPKKREFPS